MLFGIAVLSTLLMVSRGYRHFQDLIPNGNRIPHSCLPGEVWDGVGHENPSGGGARNPFGTDFARNNFVWDECLCRHDSDRDGLTNGEELGDPDCIWTSGMEPSRSSNLSHPGVCEPKDSVSCGEINAWLHCDGFVPFHCPAFEAEDTEHVLLRIAQQRVPPQETTYMCTSFDFPQHVMDGEFHIVGIEPYIDNVDIMHHLIAWGCRDDVQENVHDIFRNSQECANMATRHCDQMLYVWGFGIGPECFSDEYGVRIGKDGFTTVILEFHWNNPQLLNDETDSSGVTFHYTPNIRPNDAGNIFIGVLHLEIPPGQKEVMQQGVCPSECTHRMFSETVYLSAMGAHMHLIGKRMTVVLIRDGEVIRYLINALEYDYNSPQIYKFNPPVKVLPGDEILTTCYFDSSDRTEYTYFDSATSDEMCLSIVQYYPVQASIDDCASYDNNTVGFCSGLWGEENLDGCNKIRDTEEEYESFVEEYRSFLELLVKNCDINGLECFAACPEVIDYVSTQRCFSKKNVNWFKNSLGPRIDSDGVLPSEYNTTIFTLTMASCSYLPVYDTIEPSSPPDLCPVTDGYQVIDVTIAKDSSYYRVVPNVTAIIVLMMAMATLLY